MFTGIVETTAKILQRTHEILILSRPKELETLELGQSIAVNGACLSVTQFNDESMAFDVLSETFRKTNLGIVKIVNIERAMPANGRFEGHVVLGHIDGTIKFLKREKEISGEKFTFEFPNNFQKYIVEKGSISLNGISLTLCDIAEKTFSVYIIPMTAEKTNFGILETGDYVNFEIDYFAKLVLKK